MTEEEIKEIIEIFDEVAKKLASSDISDKLFYELQIDLIRLKSKIIRNK